MKNKSRYNSSHQKHLKNQTQNIITNAIQKNGIHKKFPFADLSSPLFFTSNVKWKIVSPSTIEKETTGTRG